MVLLDLHTSIYTVYIAQFKNLIVNGSEQTIKANIMFSQMHIVCTLSPFLLGRVEPPAKFSGREGLARPQILDEGCLERDW